jgi:hypothetical protein
VEIVRVLLMIYGIMAGGFLFVRILGGRFGSTQSRATSIPKLYKMGNSEDGLGCCIHTED